VGHGGGGNAHIQISLGWFRGLGCCAFGIFFLKGVGKNTKNAHVSKAVTKPGTKINPFFDFCKFFEKKFQFFFDFLFYRYFVPNGAFKRQYFFERGH